MHFESLHCIRAGQLIVLACALLAVTSMASERDLRITEAIRSGDATLGVRYRFEHVDQDGFSDDANASTLRLRLNYRTAAWQGWTGLVEFDAVEAIGRDDYNSGAGTSGPSRNRYPVIADPDYAEINQLFVEYHPDSDRWWTRLGRQRINLDNQRFIGGVGWRQNEQTYDAAQLNWQANSDLTLSWLIIRRVNRIFADQVAAGNHDHHSHLLHGHWLLSDQHQLDAYHYRLDNRDVPALSSQTTGLRLSARDAAESPRWSAHAELAYQSDVADQPVHYSEPYYRLDGRLKAGPVHLQLGLESLGGNRHRSGASVQTPLATLHAFNGWTDQFLSTPDAGLRDVFVGVEGAVGQWSWNAVWHDFQAEDGSEAFGRELDGSLSRQFANGNALLLKAAAFDGDQGRPDVRKFWLMFSTQF